MKRIPYEGDRAEYQWKKFVPDEVWDEGTLRIASYRNGRFWRYFFPQGHKFSVGQHVMVRLRNQHDQPHRYAGLVGTVLQQPTETRQSYVLEVSTLNEIWPKDDAGRSIFLRSGQIFNEIEYNLTFFAEADVVAA